MFTKTQRAQAQIHFDTARDMDTRYHASREVLNKVAQSLPLAELGLTAAEYNQHQSNAAWLHDSRPMGGDNLTDQAKQQLIEAQLMLWPTFKYLHLKFRCIRLTPGEAMQVLQPSGGKHGPSPLRIPRSVMAPRFFGMNNLERRFSVSIRPQSLEELEAYADQCFRFPRSGFWIVWPAGRLPPNGISVENLPVLRVVTQQYGLQQTITEMTIATPTTDTSIGRRNHHYFLPDSIEKAWETLARYHLIDMLLPINEEERRNWGSLPEYIPPPWARRATHLLFAQEMEEEGGQLQRKSAIITAAEKLYEAGLYSPPNPFWGNDGAPLHPRERI